MQVRAEACARHEAFKVRRALQTSLGLASCYVRLPEAGEVQGESREPGLLRVAVLHQNFIAGCLFGASRHVHRIVTANDVHALGVGGADGSHVSAYAMGW